MKKHTKIMGIVNNTPDSFSDGGRFEREDILEVVSEMVEAGATVIDIGGESTGPGSVEVSVEEELGRVVGVVKAVAETFPDIKISVDTWKSEVAEAALEAGADMINDVTSGRGDPRIFEVVAAAKGGAGVPMVLMYSKDDSPRTSREEVDYEDVMKTVKDFLEERIKAARAAGVKEIIVDPGMGMFVSAKPEYSWEIIDRVEELNELGFEILVGASRKSFLGGEKVMDRLDATVKTTKMLWGRVDYLRVHDVLENLTAVR